MTEPGPRVDAALRALFSGSEADRARQMLVRGISSKTPGLTKEAGLERVRLAALKSSNGSLDTLAACIALAQTDYRDLLMGAGFGHDTKAHLTWEPDPGR